MESKQLNTTSKRRRIIAKLPGIMKLVTTKQPLTTRTWRMDTRITPPITQPRRQNCISSIMESKGRQRTTELNSRID